MFGFFKKKSKLELLNEKYQKLQKEAYQLSTSNRTQSDAKYAEADVVLKEIEALEKEAKQS
ncbi:MAG: hypothetical protein ACI9RM_002080 [Ulvibacter sp.]|jgi:hypothetical protein